MPALNTIAEQQENPTHNTESKIKHFLEYAATNPSTIVQYKASNMILHIDIDASYLSKPQECRRTEGHYHPSSLSAKHEKYPNLSHPANGPMHT